MQDHMKVLKELFHYYKNRQTIALIMGTTPEAIYFWQYRKKIPEQFHGKLIAIGFDPKLLISDYEHFCKLSIMLRNK